MKTNTSLPLTVDRANLIQGEWMALDCNAPDAEKRRVFALCDELPKDYFSLSADGMAVAMYSGQPRNMPMPVAECVKYWGADMDRRVAWMGSRFVKAPHA